MSVAKNLLVLVLYMRALIKRAKDGRKPHPKGLKAVMVTSFTDPEKPGKLFGVAVFLIPRRHSSADYGVLFGPFGSSSNTKLWGYSLYAIDTWGDVTDAQLEVNPQLRVLQNQNPDMVLRLVGVRRVFGFHIHPLNKGQNFTLVRKN